MSDEQKEHKKLEIPEFTSDIPAHLLKGCSDQDAYIMEQLSIQKQQNTFIIKKLSDFNDKHQNLQNTVDNNTKRLDSLEEKKKMFTSKPMMIAVGIIGFTFLFVVYPYLLSLEFKELMPLIKEVFL